MTAPAEGGVPEPTPERPASDLLLAVHVVGLDASNTVADDLADELVRLYNEAHGLRIIDGASVALWPSCQWLTPAQIGWLMRCAQQTSKAMNLARYCVKALGMADLYLDGFIWVTEPEFSELRKIRRASKKAKDQMAALGSVRKVPRG